MLNQLHMVTGICYGFEVMLAAESPNTPSLFYMKGLKLVCMQ